MNTQSIIQELALPKDEKLILSGLARMFDSIMPTSLYLDPYEFVDGEEVSATDFAPFEGFPNTTPDQWERFLDIPEIYRYRHAKIAKQTEYAAIKAMKGLERAGQTPGAGAVTALKEIASLSKQLNASNNNKQKVIMTYVTPKAREEAK